MIRKYPNDLDQLKNSLSPIIYKYVEEGKNKADFNLFLNKGYTTAMACYDGNHLNRLLSFKDLTDFVIDVANEYFDEHDLPKDKLNIVMNWANVYPTGSFIQSHNHITFDKLLSAVFYLKSDKDSGMLCLKDREPQLINEGEVFLFPSKIEHWTTPNESKHDRVMVGYDIYYGNMTEDQITKVLNKFQFY